ncbi:TPA: hypothetical protein PNT49_004299 [Salmonella enterica]|nr:hypothetical protein [Salmonella enterica]HDI5624208.1 hypothetical protein [Salmonella enterica]
MAVKIFRSDHQPASELAYRNWLRDNPDGFVVNTLKSASGRHTKNDERFTRIHRAKCKTINPLLSSTEKSGFTTEKHQKLCATDFEVADSEARKITGLKFVKRCPNCI